MSRNPTETYREIIFNLLGGDCDNCGKVGRIDELEIHHRDEDSSNNSPENIQILCKQCHRDVHKNFPKKEFGPWSRRMRSDYPPQVVCSMKESLKGWIRELDPEEVLSKVREKKKQVRYLYLGYLYKWGLVDRNGEIRSDPSALKKEAEGEGISEGFVASWLEEQGEGVMGDDGE